MNKNWKIIVPVLTLCMILVGIGVMGIYQTKESKHPQIANTANITDKSFETETSTSQPSTAEKEEEPNSDPKREVLEQYYELGVVKENVNYLNIREMPTEDSLIIGKMPKYCGMNILDKLSDWYYVQSGDIVGYVSAEFVATGTEAETLAVENCSKMLQVIPETLDVHKEPSEDSPVWSKLNQNERYLIKDQVDDWYLLDFNSEDAYVSAKDVVVGYYLPKADGWTSVKDCSEPRRELIEYGMQ